MHYRVFNSYEILHNEFHEFRRDANDLDVWSNNFFAVARNQQYESIRALAKLFRYIYQNEHGKIKTVQCSDDLVRGRLDFEFNKLFLKAIVYGKANSILSTFEWWWILYERKGAFYSRHVN